MSVLRSAAKLAFATADLFLPSPSGPRILIYHQVGAGLGRQMEVTVEDFEWQLDWLVDNREVVDLDTALRRWNEPGSDRLVVLTFDDGYSDTYTTAFPMLRARNVPFMLYIATEMIERGNADQGPPLGWWMIREMLKSGLMEVGAHTHTHCDLRNVESETIRSELSISDRLIGENTGLAPRHFAYPWGYWSEQAHALVAERYESAVLGAVVGPASGLERHLIHRYPIQLSDGKMFLPRRLQTGLVLEERVRRRLRGYEGP